MRRNAQRVMGHALRGEFDHVAFYARFLGRKRSFDWYHDLFISRKACRGEITPQYALLSDDMIARIVSRWPDLKVIYSVRNPVDRAWSACRYQATRSGRDAVGEAQAMEFLDAQPQNYHGKYLENTERWTRHLKPGHMLILFYDALGSQADAAYQDVCDFLDIPVAPISGDHRVNASIQQDIPETFLSRAQEIFAQDIKDLDAAWGGYCTDWAGGDLVSRHVRPASFRL